MSGAQTSTFSNVLYDPLMASRQTSAENVLMQQQQDIGGHELEMGARLAGTLLSSYDTPEARAAAYPTLLAQARQVAPGYFKNAPAVYPGDEPTKALARLGTPSSDLYKLQLGRQALDAVYPGPTAAAAPATSGAPATGGDGLTGDKSHDLPLIAQRKSGGNPTVLNYVAQGDPTAYARGATASGKYQIVNSTWREGMQLAGLDPSQYATARDAPEPVQDKVASAIYDKYGNKPWQKGPQDWVKDEQGRYQMATVRSPAGAPGGVPSAPSPGGPGAPATPTPYRVASNTPVPPPASSAPASGQPAALPPTDAVVQARSTGQPVPVAGTQGLWALPNGNLTSNPPAPVVQAVPAQQQSATAQPTAQATAPPPLTQQATTALQLDQDHLTPQDHIALSRFKASLAASGVPNAPQLLQADIERRQTQNLAQQHQALEDARQAEADQRARTQLQLSQKADARAEAEAKRAGLPTGYRLDDSGKAYRIDGLPPDPAVLEQQANAGKQVQRQFEQENSLRDEFQKLTSDFRIVQTSYENIRAAAKANDGAGDMSLLYAYVRMLDPTSVVRESEFAAAAASGSLGQRVQTAYERIASGARMPESLRQSFVREAGNLYNNQLRSHNTVADQYEQLARDNGLEPKRVVTRFARPQEDTRPPLSSFEKP